MSHELKPGSEPVVGYTLIDRLGKGGFGEVWKATGPGGFQVALKFVMLDGRVGSAELRALEVIKSIRHPHLLANFGSWQTDGRLIIAMELAEKTLSDRLNECVDQGLTGIPAPEIFEYFLEAAKGLDFLNEPRHPTGEGATQGIQHRDIKPQNLLLVGGSVKVADFGLARVLEHSTTGHTGAMTPHYAPPEFFEQKTMSQSDQYSLAVTYCQLRGGRLPFEGHPAAVIAGHLYREPDLSMLPEVERGAVARALAKPSRERWPSCRAFVQAVMATEGVEAPLTVAPVDSSWKRTTHPDTASSGPADKPDPLSELAPAAHRSRKRSVYKLGVWALVAAALLFVVVLSFRRHSTIAELPKPLEKTDEIRAEVGGTQPESNKSGGTPGREAPKANGRFVSLFDGETLAGWTFPLGEDKHWAVQDGNIRVSGINPGHDCLMATSHQDFGDFHLRMEVRRKNLTDFRMYCRSHISKTNFDGYVFHAGGRGIRNIPHYMGEHGYKKPGDVAAKQGSQIGIHSMINPTLPGIGIGAWHRVELVAKGAIFRMFVDDQEVSSFEDVNARSGRGRIAFRPMPGAQFEIRKIEIMELPERKIPDVQSPDAIPGKLEPKAEKVRETPPEDVSLSSLMTPSMLFQ